MYSFNAFVAAPATPATPVAPVTPFVAALTTVPAEDWYRNWPADRTIILRKTSKEVRHAVDKICPPVVVRRNWKFWHSDSEFSQKIEIMARGLNQMKERCKITSLSMSNSTVDKKSFPFLVSTLGSITQGLLHLDFSNNCICDEKTIEFIKLLADCQGLESLVLKNNLCRTNDVIDLVLVLQTLNNLAHLDLTNNKIRPYGAERLFGVLGQCPALKHVDISHNKIGDIGAIALTEALPKCKVLARISIISCDIGNTGAERLFGVLGQCPTLAHVELSCNLINDAGVCRIVEMLPECSALNTLTRLDISYNEFGSIGSEKIAEMLHNVPTLKCSYSYHS